MMCKLTINSTFSDVRLASNLIAEFCQKHKLKLEMQRHLELILAEALNNVVEHAYEEKPDGNILIELEKVDINTVIKITDHGIAAPGTVLTKDSALPNENKLPEGGWGLCLIQALTDTVEYIRHTDHNTLILTKSVV